MTQLGWVGAWFIVLTPTVAPLVWGVIAADRNARAEDEWWERRLASMSEPPPLRK